MVAAREDWWAWLRKGCLNRTTEALIKATQEHAIRTNNIKTKADKTQACVEKLKRV